MSFDIDKLIRRMYSRPGAPMAIIGPPGIGKTAQVIQAAKKLGYPYKVFIASTCEETDIAGLPALLDGKTTTITPEWGIEFGKTPGVLILDEFNRARPEVLNAMLTLIQDRTFPNGKDKLHPHTIIIALMNEAEMVGAEELCPAMNNRFGWIIMKEPPVREHLRWFKTGNSNYDTVEQRQKAESKGIDRPAADPISLEDWMEWVQAADENAADLKELYEKAYGQDLSFASEDQFNGQRRNSTPRSVTNLLYFSEDAAHVAKYAQYFLDDRNAAIFRTAFAKMQKSAPNMAMRSGRETTPSGDSSDRLQNAIDLSADLERQSLLSKVIGGTDDDDI